MVAATGGYAIYRASMKTPSVIIADSNGGPPKLDMEALNKMGDANRQRALADYGRALAEARGSNTVPPWATGAGSDPRHQEMRQMISQLPYEDRRAVFKAMGERREVERREEIKAFFKLSPEEQRAELDKRLDAIADRQRAIQARASSQGQTPGNDARGWRPQNSNPEARLQRFRERLDSSTPEDRALQQAYFAALQKRAVERGIPFGGGRPGGGFGR